MGYITIADSYRKRKETIISPYASNVFSVVGYSTYRFDYQGILCEVQFSFSDDSENPQLLPNLTQLTEFVTGASQYYKRQSLNDGDFSSNHYDGFTSDAFNSYKVEYTEQKIIDSIWLAPQNENGAKNVGNFFNLYGFSQAETWVLIKSLELRKDGLEYSTISDFNRENTKLLIQELTRFPIND